MINESERANERASERAQAERVDTCAHNNKVPLLLLSLWRNVIIIIIFVSSHLPRAAAAAAAAGRAEARMVSEFLRPLMDFLCACC